ncbi:MAG: acyltransferase, partial [Azoarcus sp.]|nr:acyltransferase [Azoarcus sp.]
MSLPAIPQSVARPDFRQDIQGLRAVAVLAVMLFHANSAWLPAGFIGVDVFFVISGFVVSRLILDRQFDWRGFYLGRIRRIVPAYLFMLLVVALIAIFLLIPQDFKFFRDSLKSATVFTSNHYFSGFGDYFAPSSHELPLLHTWSLAIEMQFYLVLPLLLVWLPHSVPRVALPLFIAVVIAWSACKANQPTPMYFSFLARSAEFGFGVWLAIISPVLRLSGVKAELASVVGVVLLLLGFFIIPEAAFPGVWVLLPCLGAFLMIAACDTRLSRVLSNRTMVNIGTISYSLYLWHWPVLAFMRYYTQQYELSPPWLAAYVAVAFAFAAFSYRYVETTFRKPINLVVMRGGALFTLGLLAVFLTQGKALNGSLAGALPVELTRYADDAKICHGKVIAGCIRGDLTRQPVALVIGDSHAAQLNLAFDEIGTRHGLAFQVVTASSCIPIEGFDVGRLPDWAQKPCMDQIAYMKPLIASANTVVLAGMWQQQTQSTAFMQALERFLEDMQKRGIRLIVLGQVPMLDFNAIRMHRFSELGLPLTKPRAVLTDESNGLVSNLVKKYRNAVFV